MKKHNWSKPWLGAVLALVAMFCAQTTQANNLLVSNTSDSGAGSLRQAIQDNAAQGGGSTITFANGVTGTIMLTGHELTIANNLTITGPGANVLAVNGNAVSRVFHILSGATVAISDLSIANGNVSSASAGGGIYNDHSTLTLSNCTVSGNSAGYGGGIYSDNSMLTVTSCTLSHNSAGFGGGIYNNAESDGNGTLRITTSTLSGNSAANTGGAILNNAYSATVTLSVIACTLSGNSATTGGGIYNDSLGGSASLEIGDTILKAGASGENIFNRGTVIPRGYNLSSDNGGGVLIASTDRLNTEPMLGPLQNNGGPTPTMMPLPGSPAIDQGNSGNVTTLTTDQRGRQRIYDDPTIPNATLGDGSDIGAVEVIRPPISLVVTNNNDSGPGSLRQVLSDAINNDSITFAANVTGTIALTTGELGISKSVIIGGPGAKVLTVSGTDASRVFHITSGSSLLVGLGIANGHTPDGGGGIAIEGNGSLAVTACTICNCYAGGAGLNAQGGGGIYVGPVTLAGVPTLSITASTICSNTTPYYGGGLMLNRATGSLGTCTVAGNRTLYGGDSDAGGGGIFVNNNDLYVSCSTIANNSSAGNGGGIYLYKGYTTVRSSLIAGNTAAGAGPDCSGQLPGTLNWGAFTSTGYNLVGKTNFSTGFSAATHDLLGSIAAPLDPKLGPLQDNGGGTPTMALLDGSPAVDQGSSPGPTLDQRGQPRLYDSQLIADAPGGDGSDIGAFEVNPPTLTSARTPGGDLVLCWYGGGRVYSLEASTSLNGAVWTPVPVTPTTIGGLSCVTISVTQGNKFYRLRTP